MNLDGYNIILGMPFMFQHQMLLGFNPTQVIIKSPVSQPLRGDQITVLASLAMDLEDAHLDIIRAELQEYAWDICHDTVNTPLPPLHAINHTIPLLDEGKVYPW